MGIFDNDGSKDVFTRYQATLVFRDKLMGGAPGDPKVVQVWLRKTLDQSTTHEDVKRQAIRHMLAVAGEDDEYMDSIPDGELQEEWDRVIERISQTRNATVFKRDDGGIYIEARHIKSMIKEVTNILYAGDKWGKTRKGPRNYVAERVFVSPDRIHLGQPNADGAELFIGHVSGPQGPRSTMTHYEFVQGAEVSFEVMVANGARDQLEDYWPDIWRHAQENGLGALRSQGHGRFDITRWDCMEVPKRSRKKKQAA